MAPRANWKGYLRLSLVTCSVALFPATTTRERTRFNIINRETGKRAGSSAPSRGRRTKGARKRASPRGPARRKLKHAS